MVAVDGRGVGQRTDTHGGDGRGDPDPDGADRAKPRRGLTKVVLLARAQVRVPLCDALEPFRHFHVSFHRLPPCHPQAVSYKGTTRIVLGTRWVRL